MDAAYQADTAGAVFSPFQRTRPFRTATGEHQVVVTEDDLDSAAHCVAAQFQAQAEYVRLSTWLIGLLPVAYGLLTWVFGDALWAASPVYRTALAVPYAPQSWGTVFVALGVASIALAELNRHRADAVCCMLTAVILASFMVSFAMEAVQANTLAALPPALVYALFALLYMNRARLSWKSRRS